MLPFAPRQTDFLGIRVVGGWKVKSYSVRYGEAPIDWASFAGGIALAEAALPTPAVRDGRVGVAVLILHRGNGMSYAVLAWWDRENELPLRVFVSENDSWRAARNSESVCVWDLEILWREREAYVRTVLAASGPNVDEYLAFPRTTMRIRTADASDVIRIHQCLSDAFEPYRGEYTGEAYADSIPDVERLTRRMQEMVMLVAEDDQGGVLGTVAYHLTSGGDGHLRGMAVRRTAQRSGAASALLARAERELGSLGACRVLLDTTAPLRTAIRFYTSRGYSPTGVVRDFYGMPLLEYAKPLEASQGRA